MPLGGDMPDGARLIAVLGGLPERAGAPAVGVESLILPFQSVGDNVLLGTESSGGFFLRKATLDRRAAELLARVGLSLAPSSAAIDLDPVERRAVELARALARSPEHVLIDDRQSRFTVDEHRRWLEVLAHAARTTRVFVAVDSLPDLHFGVRAFDLVAVVRNGDLVDWAEPDGAAQLAKSLVGNAASAERPVRVLGPIVLELQNVTVCDPVHRERVRVENASLTVRAGEIIGLGGAQDLALGIFGASTGGAVTGTMFVDGNPVDLSTVERAIAARVLFISEHPPTYDVGIIGGVPTSVSGTSLARLARLGIIDRRREYVPRRAPSMLLEVIPGAPSRPSTSDMNEVLAGWAAQPPRVAILTEPFSGLSPTEVTERRTLIEGLADVGIAVLLEAADAMQLIDLSDRILLQAGTRISTELRGGNVSALGLAAYRLRTYPQSEN
ncbi:sugar ABC transporter ATP-binding protein [Mycetocola zhadangensis]|uniref:Sugar ABC transporter ATP-binding protein n=1 Tax=Mycetocola zhadangensis TaxID=1164595 RepID=A0A3L7IUJ1_9MICO|nr:sugar ABC transporter ATP-binding protein [Mycetocola zhadangensis]RLQ80971.1 sugar ABC transporter ATP-binding protein [Mycetocola zhadangensis]GGF03599.1 L-arabinose ABC transporter ATP-binding protein [Mycetocola zhadangensis]